MSTTVFCKRSMIISMCIFVYFIAHFSMQAPQNGPFPARNPPKWMFFEKMPQTHVSQPNPPKWTFPSLISSKVSQSGRFSARNFLKWSFTKIFHLVLRTQIDLVFHVSCFVNILYSCLLFFDQSTHARALQFEIGFVI